VLKYYVTQEGRPLNPRRIAIGIRRMYVPELDVFKQQLQTATLTNIPVRFQGEWQVLSGVVRQIRLFTDGALVLISSPSKGSLLDHWKDFPVWIPPQGEAGVLAPTF
jgi:hypothetical protein